MTVERIKAFLNSLGFVISKRQILRLLTGDDRFTFFATTFTKGRQSFLDVLRADD